MSGRKLATCLIAATVAGCSSTASHVATTGANSSSGTSATGGASTGGLVSPIVAPDDEWTWVDFPAAVCASGEPTGLTVNPHAASTELLIYFEGGGFCTDATTCWGPDAGATNLARYDAMTFASNAPSYPVLKRATSGSPFAGMNMVYVPYCTGDLHSGDIEVDLALPDGGQQPTYFYGAEDVDVFLTRLVPTFNQITRIWLLGTSAGGFGTFLNFDRVASAFGPHVGIDIIDDSGPPLVARGKTDNSGLFAIWGSPLPAGCSGCVSLSDVLAYDLHVQQGFSPPGRFAFLSFDEDTVISKDFGWSLAAFPGLLQSFSLGLPASPAAATFLVSNFPSHVVESDPALAVDYLPWMSQMVSQDPAWADATHDGGL